MEYPVYQKTKKPTQSQFFKGCPRVPVPPFFHPLLRTGWCSAAACLPSPSVMDGGMAASTWTRAPFCEVWGKPESCRTLQEFIRWLNYMHPSDLCQDKKRSVCPFRSFCDQLPQKESSDAFPNDRLSLTNPDKTFYNSVSIILASCEVPL